MVGAAVRKPRVPNDKKVHRVTDNRLLIIIIITTTIFIVLSSYTIKVVGSQVPELKNKNIYVLN